MTAGLPLNTMYYSSNVRGGGGWGPSGRQSMLPPTPGPASHALKDPRNIRDKAVQASMRNTIHEWLQETEFPGILSKQTLLSPTAKDFRQIFEHLVSLLDPATDLSFETGQGQNRDKNAKRFEDEVLLILKSHHYPFADAIDKKWLAAPASMHSWPQLLACLHWLVGMSRVSTPSNPYCTADLLFWTGQIIVFRKPRSHSARRGTNPRRFR